MKSDIHNFNAHRRDARGFTLIELVIALAMVAVLAVTLARTIFAFKNTTYAEAAIEPSRSASLALDIIQADLQNALTPNVNSTAQSGTNMTGAVNATSDGVLVQSFEATQSQDDRGHEADDVIFFSTAESPKHVDSIGDIKQIELTVQSPSTAGVNDHVLVRNVTGNLLAMTNINPDTEILCRGVSAFSIQYYTGSEWLTTWDSTQEDNTIPVAVQITLALDRVDPGTKETKTYQFVRTFTLPNSTAATDTNVNAGGSLP